MLECAVSSEIAYQGSSHGGDLTSETLKTLNNWLGIRHNVSLVDRPQSSGVEHTNKLILKHRIV
jgi:hypothetical protein